MGSLLVVTGPPGAGKSTVARVLTDRLEHSVLVAGDAFFAFLASGAVKPWLPEADQQNQVVTRAAGTATGTFVRGGYTTVYDGVVGPWFLPTFAAATGLAELDYVVLLPTVQDCVERVITRGNHGFTDKPATRHMHRQFAEADVDARHLLVDPPRDPAEVAEVVLRARAGGRLAYAA